MLRLFLPPNLAAAAARDAIAVRVEMETAARPADETLPALALLQRWCATPVPPKFIQLTRFQLRELIAALRGQPAFFRVETPAAAIEWSDENLAGVSELLADTEPPMAAGASLPEGRTPTRSAPTPRKNKIVDPPASPMAVDGTEHYLAITLPAREHPTYAAALELVKAHGFILEPSNRKWWLRDRHKTLNFLAAHGARLRGMFGADFSANFEKNTAHLQDARISADITEADGGFALELAVRAGSADDSHVRNALASSRGYVESEGKIFLVDQSRLERLAQAQRALAGQPGIGLSTRSRHRISTARINEAQQIMDELVPGFQAPAAWRVRGEALRNLSALTPAPLSRDFDRQLRQYQRVGIAWLWHLWRHELGGVLADEMGLGKTLQALGLLAAIHVRGATQPAAGPILDSRPNSGRASGATGVPTVSLVVCPASLLENWRRESVRFAPELRVFVHHGERRLDGIGAAADFDLIITSYGTLARDRERFADIEFTCVIADEAQHIKNRRSQNAVVLRSLRARSRFLLTGTPLENSLDDLRSLFDFLLPGYIDRVPEGVRGEERAWFNERLRAKAAPYLLRRTKEAVAPELPAKLEQIIWCDLLPAQAALYRAMQEKTERDLIDLAAAGAGEGQLRFAALTQLLRLRQICCDPRLVEAGRAAADAASEVGHVAPNAPGLYDTGPEQQVRDPAFAQSYAGRDNAPYADSAKLEAFRELLGEAIDDGHRVLVFSQFTSLLALLRTELEAQGVSFCYLDGSMPPRARQAEVDRFQSSPDVPVFLLSLKAGGTGLNLTGADTVVHFDPWWNPAAEAQATDRAHRIGQSRVVTSYKLIAAGTVEEKVLALQDSKRALLADVFEASDAAAAKLSLADLQSLLKT